LIDFLNKQASLGTFPDCQTGHEAPFRRRSSDYCRTPFLPHCDHSTSIMPLAIEIFVFNRKRISIPNKPSMGPPNGNVCAITTNSPKLFSQCAEAGHPYLRRDNLPTPCAYSFVLRALSRANPDGLQNFYRQDRVGRTCIDKQVDDFCAARTCHGRPGKEKVAATRQRVASRQNITTRS
jgi:hypothetical protein